MRVRVTTSKGRGMCDVFFCYRCGSRMEDDCAERQPESSRPPSSYHLWQKNRHHGQLCELMNDAVPTTKSSLLSPALPLSSHETTTTPAASLPCLFPSSCRALSGLFPALRQLRSLSLSLCGAMGDESLAHLAHAPSLAQLDVHCCWRLTDTGAGVWRCVCVSVHGWMDVVEVVSASTR